VSEATEMTKPCNMDFMANAVLFLRWHRPFPGSEEKAYSYLFQEGLKYLHGVEGQAIERMELVGLTPYAGDLNWCVVLLGKRAQLDELRRTDEFESFAMTMNSLFDRFGVIPGVNEEGILAALARRAARAKE
jgi:hypothetical protein